MRVALIHYWLIDYRGGEKTLKAISEIFPQSDIYAHVVDAALVARAFPSHRVTPTFISRLPFARTLYQKYLPLMPFALEQLDLRNYDLVISSESGPAKGVIVSPHAMHVSYCHSPMRYIWDMYHNYRERAGIVTRVAMAPVLHGLRMWDQVSAQRVDNYIANSNFVAARIQKYYRRDSTVIHPPVAIEQFEISAVAEDFYLSVGQLVTYKRADLLVEAFNESGKPLVIIGEGALLGRLRRIAKSNVRLLGWQTSEVIHDHYRRCRAVILPGTEDFGIVPVEAMACGKPVLAYGQGGALETVIDGVSGLFFREQTIASLNRGVDALDACLGQFNPVAIRAHAGTFSSAIFKERFTAHLSKLLGTAEWDR
jgi:glycosyltransferase involved in cell wall biosynthesis